MGDVQFLWTIQSESYKGLPRYDGTPSKPRPMPDSNLTSFYSEFVGNTLQDLSHFLQRSPEDLQLDREYFVVVDQETKDGGSMMLCKIKDGGVLHYRRTVEEANSYIGSMNLGYFEEMVEEAKKNLKHKPAYS